MLSFRGKVMGVLSPALHRCLLPCSLLSRPLRSFSFSAPFTEATLVGGKGPSALSREIPADFRDGARGRQGQVYMFSVSWSDGTDILVYRTLEEFKKLHKHLMRKFPIESGLLKKTDRSIPKFPAAHLRLRTDRSRSLERLKQFEAYSTELLQAKAKVSRGEDVTRFFEAQRQDLDPSFPENSIIILPSEMGEKKGERPEPSVPTITQPIVSQSYRCLEAFATEDTKNRPFRATRGETLEVLVKDSTGWWLVENDQKQIAWFPASYLEETEEASAIRETDEEELLYYITRSYKARHQDELSVSVGVVVQVLKKSDIGWWLVRYNGHAGYIPSVSLRPYKNPHCKFLALAHGGLGASTPNLTDVSPFFGRHAPRRQQGIPSDTAPPRDTEGEEDSPLSRIRSRSFGGAVAAAASAVASDQDSLSDSSGSGSEQGLCWAPGGAEAQSLGKTPQPASGAQSSSSWPLDSKKQSDSGFAEETSACADRSPCSSPDSEGHPGGPVVPPRPSSHEILQKCSTITRRAVQGTRPRPTLPACAQSPQ
ncbi:NADPH oxidase organizer 1 isoform X2 [Paroedura picta]|uniref:NADPH oxidase organizer 1 isoform X2 n=1 Tax=Paroedura picta TaxID=143630 RepID=UPI0040565011